MKRVLLAMVLVGACKFTPAKLAGLDGGGGSADAPVAIDGSPADAPIATADAPIATADAPIATADARRSIDARPVDAHPIDATRPDAHPPDAHPIDAYVDPCPSASTSITLGTPVNGSTSGTSMYQPTCADTSFGPTGPETFYRVDVPAGTSKMDLVVDVQDFGTLDAIVSISTGCTAGSELACSDVASQGDGEVAVIPNVTPGTYYIAVDGWNGRQGSFTLTAWLRSIKGFSIPCDPTLVDSRCDGSDTACVSPSTGSNPLCEKPAVQTTPDTKDFLCRDPSTVSLTNDAMVTGTAGAVDDVFELVPSASGNVRLVFFGANGGCDVDSVVNVYSNADSCTTPVATDHNSGLGPCPETTFAVTKGTKYWVDVTADNLANSGTYLVAVDFL